MRALRPIGLALAAAALLAAGCSEETSEEAAKNEDSKADLREEGGAAPQPAATAEDKPKVEVPKGAPPKTLQIDDIKVGKGPAAKAGSSVTVNYVGVHYEDGKEFDTSFGGQPLPVQLGSGMVIPGFEKGISGMKVGGRRRLVIPPKDAYGARGQPPVIKPNETLVFVIDLVSLQ